MNGKMHINFSIEEVVNGYVIRLFTGTPGRGDCMGATSQATWVADTYAEASKIMDAEAKRLKGS